MRTSKPITQPFKPFKSSNQGGICRSALKKQKQNDLNIINPINPINSTNSTNSTNPEIHKKIRIAKHIKKRHRIRKQFVLNESDDESYNELYDECDYPSKFCKIISKIKEDTNLMDKSRKLFFAGRQSDALSVIREAEYNTHMIDNMHKNLIDCETKKQEKQIIKQKFDRVKHLIQPLIVPEKFLHPIYLFTLREFISAIYPHMLIASHLDINKFERIVNNKIIPTYDLDYPKTYVISNKNAIDVRGYSAVELLIIHYWLVSTEGQTYLMNLID
jgi:hypothetical protein